MTDESTTSEREGPTTDDETEGDIPLGRRELMKWGVVGAAIGPTATASESVERVWDSRESRRVATKTTPRSYLPEMDYPLSIRGIAPERNTARGSNVWLSSTQFSVSALISEQGFSRRPVSLREIVTPQRTQQTPLAQRSVTWENWLGDHDQPSRDYEFTPPSQSRDDSRRELLQTVSAHATGEFRGVGSGHSHSEAAKPKSNFTDVKNITGDLGLRWVRDPSDSYWDDPDDPSRPHPDHPTREHLVRLGAGTVLQRLNRGILPNKSPPLALPNMGSWDGQTLAGAINTSTHGTGLGMGTFADLVRSVEMVTVPESPVAKGEAVVRMFRIEPNDGITDPAEFGAHTREHDATLIQDDEIFHSAVVGYGSLGVVYAYTLELQPEYWLHERTVLTNWQRLDPYREARANRHYSLLVDLVGPQATGTRNPLVRVRTRNRTDPGGNRVRSRGRPPTERKDRTNIFDNLVDNIIDEVRKVVAPGSREERKDPTKWKDPTNEINDQKGFMARVVQRILRDVAAPFEQDRYETASYIALRRTRAEKTAPTQTPNPPSQNAITTEIGVPASQVGAAVDRVLTAVQNDPRLYPVPLGVRFTSGSKHKFSPEYGRETAMLELITPIARKLQKPQVGAVYHPWHPTVKDMTWGEYFEFLALQKAKALLKALNMEHFYNMGQAKSALELIENPLIKQYGGRPHMGKHNTLNVSAGRSYKRPQNMYPEYDGWLGAVQYFNNFETFDGLFTGNKLDTNQLNRP